MAGRLLQTARLVLRPLDLADAPEVARLISNWNVIRWLTAPPWPYALADAKSYLSGDGSTETRAITVSGALIGAVGLHPSPDGPGTELGFWLGEPFWGFGYMSEAVRAVVADHFARSNDTLTSGYLVGNAASAKVLHKNGFRETEKISRYARPHNKDLALQRLELAVDDWAVLNPFQLETERLIIRPLANSDWFDLQRIGGQPQVARMLFNVGAPWSEANVKAWIDKSKWRGKPGFRPAVALKDGILIGTLGLSPKPFSCAYFLDPDHWGRGYATEALQAFLRASFDQFEVVEIRAAHFVDNPASGRVLTKLGFEKTGEAMGISAARLEKAPEVLYRLTRTSFEAIE